MIASAYSQASSKTLSRLIRVVDSSRLAGLRTQCVSTYYNGSEAAVQGVNRGPACIGELAELDVQSCGDTLPLPDGCNLCGLLQRRPRSCIATTCFRPSPVTLSYGSPPPASSSRAHMARLCKSSTYI